MGTDTEHTRTSPPQADQPISPQARAVADLVAFHGDVYTGGNGMWLAADLIGGSLAIGTPVHAVPPGLDILPAFAPRGLSAALSAVSAIVPDTNTLAVLMRTGESKAEALRRLKALTKQSISIPEVTWNAVEALADAEGISRSAWIARAAEQAATQQVRLGLALQAAEELAAEYEAEHGPISDEAVAEARRALGLDDEEQGDMAA